MSKEELRMSLECTIILSKDAEEAKATIAKLLKEANKTILVKGVPEDRIEGAARVTKWEVEKNKLSLSVESGAFVRAPAAILRLRKFLRSELGIRYRIGIRDIKITNFTVSLPVARITEPLINEVKSMPAISSAKVVGNILTVEFAPLTYTELKKGIPDRTLNLIESKLEAIAKPSIRVVPQVQILRQSKRKPITFKENPAKIALKLGWIKEFPGRGQWIYTPPYAALLEIIEDILVNEVVRKLGFQPCMLPKLIPLEVMKYMPGYLDGIPEGMYYVCPPPRDPVAFNRFKELFKTTREVPRGELKKIIKEPAYVLSPAQC